MARPTINHKLLSWARERAGIDVLDLAMRFPKLSSWESGEALPTLKQLEAFAKAVHVPFGYLFLTNPPNEPLPIPDFRTLDGRAVMRPSPNLLDTVYSCQERQGWYKEFAQVTRQPILSYVGSASVKDTPESVADRIRTTIGFDLDKRRDCQTWTDALRLFIQQADKCGILVMVSGVVLNNNKRLLSVEEFRGFALTDHQAPLVFINGADSKSAQMFTLAHELAHVWLGTSALSNAGAQPVSGGRREEIWCNKVAAELLVPMNALRAELRKDEPTERAIGRLAKYFKVSTLVILRRLLDARYLSRNAFDLAWNSEIQRIRELAHNGSGGGNFYRTTIARISRRFAQALVVSTMEGQTLYRDAFRMLGVAKTATFENIGREVGVLL